MGAAYTVEEKAPCLNVHRCVAGTLVYVFSTPRNFTFKMAADAGGRLGKLKSKLAEISTNIDEADQRKLDAKANIIEAIARLEKAESEVGSIDRRIKLLGQDLKTASERCDEMSGKLENVENDSAEIEERRKELEENETTGDEKIRALEDEVKQARMKLEENQTKYTEAERKYVVVKRDIERPTKPIHSRHVLICL